MSSIFTNTFHNVSHSTTTSFIKDYAVIYHPTHTASELGELLKTSLTNTVLEKNDVEKVYSKCQHLREFVDDLRQTAETEQT